MANQPKRQSISAEKWLALSKCSTIEDSIASDPYSMAYPALLSHFGRLRTKDWKAAVVGLHTVYGWMPTIPSLDAIIKWEEKEQHVLLRILTKAKKSNVPNAADLEILKRFCNNSMIGASKFLHFLRPDTFPIWDSRVAAVYWSVPKVWHYQVNGIKHWQEYREMLLKWLICEDVKKRCNDLRKLAIFVRTVSDLRLVELVMFHANQGSKK